MPLDKLGFSSIASLVNSISDVVKKVIQNGVCVCVCVCACVRACMRATHQLYKDLFSSMHFHTGQLLIVPVAKDNTTAVEQNNAIQSNGVVESDGVPAHKKMSPKKTVLSVSIICAMYSLMYDLVCPTIRYWCVLIILLFYLVITS